MAARKQPKGAWYLMVLGLLLAPIFFCTFLVDRFLMVFLVMSDAPDIVEYFQDMKYIAYSLLRMVTLGITIGIILWIW
jgi:hypothetical protein